MKKEIVKHKKRKPQQTVAKLLHSRDCEMTDVGLLFSKSRRIERNHNERRKCAVLNEYGGEITVCFHPLSSDICILVAPTDTEGTALMWEM